MTEEVLFEIEEKMSGSEIADYLRNVANKIETMKGSA
ncbi:MAG: amphi-Trp domain-containing protein [Candidatus Nanohalobium sp.]